IYIKNLLVRCAVCDVNNRIGRLPRQLAIHRKTDSHYPADRQTELRLRCSDHAVTGTQRPTGEYQRRFRINTWPRQSYARDSVVVTRDLFGRDRFLRAREIHEISLCVDTDNSDAVRCHVRRNISAERTPTTITAGEEYE